MQVTNTQQGPRGLNTEAGPVLVEPGQTVDVKLSAAERTSAQKSGWFEFGGQAEADDEGDEGGKPEIASLTDDQLRTFLGERGVKADGRWSRERLLSEAEKVQA
ncbi:hypothetical protein MEX01_48320 [Methylorubrum extorquens]|uniref:hypothetical protein n=1 Tax=Methylorubrum extorquens TaxID=408 RepID=UPI001174EA33|nr:hypothetical protein [Methylorubrum extorquens]GEL44241.1 hypothetical protein MEX01_48320 [Methylorubrum extorquens]